MNRLLTTIAVLLLPVAATAQQEDGRYECLIEPAMEISLSSPVAGVIKSIGVDRGSSVEAGQVLAQLEAAAEQAAVDLARAKLEFGERKVDRTQELYRENFTSEYSVDEAVTEARLAAVELEQARTILAQKTVRSPITGLVVAKVAEVGEFVSDDEILRLVQLDPLHIEVVVPVENLDSIRTGMQATVFPQQPVGGEYQAEVVTVDQVVDAASGTFGVRLALPNDEYKLPAGLRCTVAFPDD